MAKEAASLDEWMDNFGVTQPEEEVTEPVEEPTEDPVEDSPEEEVEDPDQPEEDLEEIPDFDITKLSSEKKLAIASAMFGTEFRSEAEVDAFKAKMAALESSQSKVDLIPKLVEKLKSSQNILSYFPDEKAYVAAQLSKQDEYKGKEAVISKVLHSNIAELPSLEVIELAAKLDAPNGIRNPFRQKLLSAGLNPDAIAEGYDTLSEDEKDTVDYLAAVERRNLSKLGADVQIPVNSDMDVLAEIEAEVTRSKEDLTAKRNTIAPISKVMIDDLKELDVTDGFKFRLEMTADERREYEDFITEAVLGREYDLSTNEGKAEMWEAVLDLAFINNKRKINVAFEKHIREEEQHNHRVKSNNAQPIKKNEPVPQKTTANKMSDQALAAKQMIDELN